MTTKILLTSFQTWLPHQESNSSDDLLAEIAKSDYCNHFSLSFLRQLPVDIKLASQQVISTIKTIKPEIIICCGMAEKRTKLTIESNATCQDKCLYTAVNLVELTSKLAIAEISQDAGNFVCEGLYYQVLKYIQSQNENIHCIFVHVPLFKNVDLDLIQKDFHLMFFELASQLSQKNKITNNKNNTKKQ